MRGAVMTTKVLTSYNNLTVENKSLVDDFIQLLSNRQLENDETLKVIEDARKGIGLSKAYTNIDDLMLDLNAED